MAELPGQEGTPQQTTLGELAVQQGIDLNAVVQLTELTQRMETSQILWRLRDITTYTLLAIFSLGNLATISLFFLI